MKVLLIEDDAALANILAAHLERSASRVVIANSMQAAAAVLKKPNGFDIVFLDLYLPDSNASQTLDDIKWIKSTGRKIVVITGAETNFDKAAIEAGADACFYKHDPDFLQSVREQLSTGLTKPGFSTKE